MGILNPIRADMLYCAPSHEPTLNPPMFMV